MTAATEDTFVDLLYRIPNSDRKELLALWTVLSEVGEQPSLRLHIGFCQP